MKQKAIQEKFNIKRSTLSDMLKNKEKIYQQSDENHVLSCKSKQLNKKQCSFQKVDDALKMWFDTVAHEPSVKINGMMILAKANQFLKK